MFGTALGKMMAWGALAICAASPAMAQEAIGGKFTLNESVRLGSTVLEAGAYTFSIEPVGTIRSVSLLRQGGGHVVLVVVKPEKSGRTASMFAMASPSGRPSESSELTLDLERSGTEANTMYLGKEGLQVNFRWNTQARITVVAQQVLPVQAGATRAVGR